MSHKNTQSHSIHPSPVPKCKRMLNGEWIGREGWLKAWGSRQAGKMLRKHWHSTHAWHKMSQAQVSRQHAMHAAVEVGENRQKLSRS